MQRLTVAAGINKEGAFVRINTVNPFSYWKRHGSTVVVMKGYCTDTNQKACFNNTGHFIYINIKLLTSKKEVLFLCPAVSRIMQLLLVGTS